MSKNYKLSHYIFPLMLGFLSMNAIAAINVYGPGGRSWEGFRGVVMEMPVMLAGDSSEFLLVLPSQPVCRG